LGLPASGEDAGAAAAALPTARGPRLATPAAAMPVLRKRRRSELEGGLSLDIGNLRGIDFRWGVEPVSFAVDQALAAKNFNEARSYHRYSGKAELSQRIEK